MKKNRLDYKLSGLMTDEERRRFRAIVRGLPEHYWDTIPKQEAIYEYIQAVQERFEMSSGLQGVRRKAAADPTNAELVKLLSSWLHMCTKIETKLTTLRNSIGLNSKKESDLEKSVKAKGAPKGGHEIKPWAS